MKYFRYFFALLCLYTAFSEANPRYSFQEKERVLLQKISDHTEIMRHEINSHDADLRTLDAKMQNIEDAIESLKQLFDANVATVNESLKKNDASKSSDLSMKNVVTDIKTLQTHINQSNQSTQSQIAQLKQTIDARNKDIDNLKSALKSLMSAIQGNTESTQQFSSSDDSFKLYKVQSGDSLGVIAQKHGKTIKEIKELNGLKNDKIILGQKLKIPN